MYVTLGLQFSFFQKPIDVLDCKLIKSKLWRNLYVLICLACFRALWKNCGRFSLHPSPFRIFFQVNRNLQMNKTSRLSQWAGNGLEWNKHPAASNFLLYSLYSTQLKWFQNFILFFFLFDEFPELEYAMKSPWSWKTPSQKLCQILDRRYSTDGHFGLWLRKTLAGKPPNYRNRSYVFKIF